MGLWQAIVDWLLDEDDTSSAGGVAVLEPEADTPGGLSAVEKEPVQRWWRPEGDLVIERPQLDRPEESDTQETTVLDGLERALGDADIELPHLPHVPQQILNLVRQDTVTMPQIAKIVSQDQVLAAAALRRANSAALGGTQKVTDLATALARLGLRGIRACMISHSVRNLTLSVGSGQSRGESLWRRSLAAAIVAAEYDDCFHVCREDAFLLGLLHDIGSVVVLRACHEAETGSRVPVSDAAFNYVCQEYHEMMGEMLAERWKLPEEVGAIVANHEAALQLDDPFADARALIQLTDATVSLLGYADPCPYALLEMPAAKHLNAENKNAFLKTLNSLPQEVERQLSEF